MRNILVSRWLKLSSVLAFIACIGVHFTIRKYSADYADWFSVTSARFECRVAYGISKPVQSFHLHPLNISFGKI